MYCRIIRCMKRQDSRRLSMDVLNERRRRAVKLRLSGMKLADVSAQTELSVPTVIAAHKAYVAGGWKAVQDGLALDDEAAMVALAERATIVVEGGVVAIFLEACRSHGRVTIFGDGRQSRDFLHVDDADRVWVAMKAGGAAVIEHGHATRFPRGDGLPHTTIYAIAHDGRGQIGRAHV